MAHKLFAVLKKDYARVMIPVNRIIDREFEQIRKADDNTRIRGTATENAEAQSVCREN